MTERFRRLAEEWRKDADRFRRRGLVQEADVVDSFANELDAVLTEWELEGILIRDAATETGKSTSQIRRDVQTGKVANIAATGPIRVRRKDILPFRSRAL